jgi:hypothetical protein
MARNRRSGDGHIDVYTRDRGTERVAIQQHGNGRWRATRDDISSDQSTTIARGTTRDGARETAAELTNSGWREDNYRA